MFGYLMKPDINPTILHIAGPIAIRWYSLMYILGFLFVLFALRYQIKKNLVKLTENQIQDILFDGLLYIIIGARLGYVLFYNLNEYLQNPVKIIAVWEGGLSFHGGLIMLLIGGYFTSRRLKMNYIDLCDVVSQLMPVCIAFGRFGNFVNGELWGKPTTVPWGMIFPDIPLQKRFLPTDEFARNIAIKVGLVIKPDEYINLPRHPSQLYELLMEGIILFIIMMMIRKSKYGKIRGIYLFTFFTGYGIARIVSEFFREPDMHIGYIFLNFVTMGMILSLPFLILGIAGLVYSLKQNKRNELWV